MLACVVCSFSLCYRRQRETMAWNLGNISKTYENLRKWKKSIQNNLRKLTKIDLKSCRTFYIIFPACRGVPPCTPDLKLGRSLCIMYFLCILYWNCLVYIHLFNHQLLLLLQLQLKLRELFPQGPISGGPISDSLASCACGGDLQLLDPYCCCRCCCPCIDPSLASNFLFQQIS